MNQLPFELVQHILDMAYPYTDPRAETTSNAAALQRASRRTSLCEASLISSLFTEAAQALLCRHLAYTSAVEATRWLSSPSAKTYATWTLDLTGVQHGDEGLSATVASKIIQKAHGVQWLRLRGFGRLSLRVFEARSLEGLQTLVLATSFRLTASQPLITPSFRLRKLALFNRVYPPNLISSILISSSETLSHLSLAIPSSASAFDTILPSFHHVAPSLQRLSLLHQPSSSFLSQLYLCTQLHTLECYASVDLATTLPAISQLDVRDLSVTVDYTTAETLKLLEKRVRKVGKGLERVERVRITGISRGEVEQLKLGGMVEEFERDGVTVSFVGGSVGMVKG